RRASSTRIRRYRATASSSSRTRTTYPASSARGRDLVEIVAPRQYTIGFIVVICEQDHDLGGGAHPPVEQDAAREPEPTPPSDGRRAAHPRPDPGRERPGDRVPPRAP